jgi:hypothetical protein
MKVEEKRCNHCYSIYTHYISGGAFQNYNHNEYCPSCYKVILDTLRTIPIKYKQVFLPIVYSLKDKDYIQNIDSKINDSIKKGIAYQFSTHAPETMNLYVINNDYFIDDIFVRKYKNMKTKEEIITVAYVYDIENDRCIGLWTENGIYESLNIFSKEIETVNKELEDFFSRCDKRNIEGYSMCKPKDEIFYMKKKEY